MCLELDYIKKRGFREQNNFHFPYIRICKLLTSYIPPDPDKIKVICKSDDGYEEPFVQIGTTFIR